MAFAMELIPVVCSLGYLYVIVDSLPNTSGVATVSVAGAARRDAAAGRLAAMRLIVTPGTIMRWHREIIGRRWGRVTRRGRSGRPPVRRNVRSVVLRLARENESWGYRWIHGELAGLGIKLAPSTVWQTLKSAGINPAPRRDGPSWAQFLRSQAQGILALDLFTADLLNGATIYVLAVIEHGTRRVRILGTTEHPRPSLGRPAGPKSGHGPRGCQDAGEVRAARPGTPASPPRSTQCSKPPASG